MQENSRRPSRQEEIGIIARILATRRADSRFREMIRSHLRRGPGVAGDGVGIQRPAAPWEKPISEGQGIVFTGPAVVPLDNPGDNTAHLLYIPSGVDLPGLKRREQLVADTARLTGDVPPSIVAEQQAIASQHRTPEVVFHG